jgi:hypothetical protein
MAVNWREFSEGGFHLVIPAPLRRMRLGSMFKGKIRKGTPETELVVLFNSDVSASMVSDWQKGFLKPPPFTEWEGLTWTYHSWGPSKSRAGGLESKFTQTAPNRCGRGHRWTITFPVGGKWVQLDIANGGGGLEWKEFEDIAQKIVQSVKAT